MAERASELVRYPDHSDQGTLLVRVEASGRSPEREYSSCPAMMHLFLFKLCKSPSLQGVAAMLVFTRHVPPAFYVKVGLCVVVV